MQLDSLKEDPDELQAKMEGENYENVKLLPILEEAYNLVVTLENHQKKAKKDIAALEVAKDKLKQKQNKLNTMQSIED